MSYKLTPRDLEALRSYATEYGRNWKSDLWLDWYRARADGERGAILHGLRNNLGPDWLRRFKFPKSRPNGVNEHD